MGNNRNWTAEEENYLKDSWGEISVKTICKTIDRSLNAVRVKAQRLKLGPFIINGSYITFHQLLITLGYSGSGGYYLISWIKNRKFPIHNKLINEQRIRIVYLNDFWKWAYKNQSVIDFSKFEENALGIEPSWAKEKRKRDYATQKVIKKTPWTSVEDMQLVKLVKQYRFTYTEIAKKMNRSEGAVTRRLVDLNIKDRPLRADRHNKWTQEELEILERGIKTGFTYEHISDLIGKSAKSIRGRVYNMYLTENLDKARNLIGKDHWGDNRPRRQLRQYNLMSAEEKQQTKDSITKFSGILNYLAQNINQDQWQRQICGNWLKKDLCNENCDECENLCRRKL